MKVKITYTTDFEQVPADCRRLLKDKIDDVFAFREELSPIYKILNTQPFQPFVAIQQIDKLRSILSDYDQALNDVQSILVGWAQHKLQNKPDDDIVSVPVREAEQ